MPFTIKSIANSALFSWATAVFCLTFQVPAAAAVALEHWTQPNGAQVYWAASPALPMVDVQLDFDAGSRRDPPAQAGLASASAAMLQKGVAASGALPALDESALGQAWADSGAQFSASASSDRLSLTLRSLTEPALLEQALSLAARVIANPVFDTAVWQRERQRWQAALREAATRPGTVAGLAYAAAVYGSHPYGYETSPASLDRIQVADMQAWHAQSLQPCRARISIVGAVSREQADALASRLLAGLPQPACASVPPLAPVAEVEALRQPAVQRIPFKAAQAQVLIGQPGYARRDPDHFALTVGNYILGGGGFVSRLAAEVRQKRGLSYSVLSAFAPGLHAGSFTVALQTRPDQAEQAASLVQQVLRDFVATGPTDAEVQAAKDNLIGGFALLLDSNRKLLGNIANIAWNDLPLDYLDTWTQQVQQVSAADISAAFARKLQPETMVTVIVGEQAAP